MKGSCKKQPLLVFRVFSRENKGTLVSLIFVQQNDSRFFAKYILHICFENICNYIAAELWLIKSQSYKVAMVQRLFFRGEPKGCFCHEPFK